MGCTSEKKSKMYTQEKIIAQKGKNGLESSKQDIPENQGNMFHVEHKRQIIRELNKGQKLKYNMKKFKATTKNESEFLFAPSLDQAKRMFNQLYPCKPLVNMVEVELNIY